MNVLDIAPRNASVVMGIVNAASNTAGFLSPMLVGFITHRKVNVSVVPLPNMILMFRDIGIRI